MQHDPEKLTSAPHTMPVRRLDDVRAAKQLDLNWKGLLEDPAGA
jgi:glycine dehydrogenase subunit 2